MKIDKNRIEKLKNRLYSRKEDGVLDRRSEIIYHEKDVSKPDWGTNTTLNIPESVSYASYNRNSFVKKFLIFSLVFFFIAIFASLFLFFGGFSSVSSQNVDIKVSGPSTVSSGEDVDMTISVLNGNRTDIENVLMTVEYPDGTRSDSELQNAITYNKYDVGTINSGSVSSESIRFYLLGDRDDLKNFNIKITYKLKGSNAVFVKEKKYDILISSSPALLDVSMPKEINSGQDININVSLNSNSPGIVRNVYIKAEYPNGFSFKDSSFKPSTSSNNEWKIGDLKNGEKKNFVIKGSLTAQNNEERTFKFSAFSIGEDNKEITLSSSDPTLLVKKSFIDLDILIGDSRGDVLNKRNKDNVSGSVYFANTLFDKLSDVSVVLKFSGNYFDRNSVNPSSGGFYRSIDNTVLWDKNSTSGLGSLDPSDEEDLMFYFDILNINPGVKNPSISLDALVSGTRSLSGGDTEKVSTKVSKIIKIITDFYLTTKTHYSTGPIKNSGNHPPKSEKETTYTVEMSISNTYNDVSDVRVMTSLPNYVSFTGSIYPQNENIVYNPDDRTVVWNVGSVGAGAGYSSSPRKAYFQVKILTSLSQVGTSPNITNEIKVSGKDTFTGVNVSSVNIPLTTSTNNLNDGIVVK